MEKVGHQTLLKKLTILNLRLGLITKDQWYSMQDSIKYLVIQRSRRRVLVV